MCVKKLNTCNIVAWLKYRNWHFSPLPQKCTCIKIETTVRLMVLRIMACDSCASSPNITMNAYAQVVWLLSLIAMSHLNISWEVY